MDNNNNDNKTDYSNQGKTKKQLSSEGEKMSQSPGLIEGLTVLFISDLLQSPREE